MTVANESSAEEMGAPIFDPAQFEILKELLEDGDMDFFDETIRQFLEDTEKLMAGLQSLVRERAFGQIIAPAHTMKGSCSTFGMALTGKISARLEAAAKEQDAHGIDHWHPKLKEAFSAGCEAMQNHIKLKSQHP